MKPLIFLPTAVQQGLKGGVKYWDGQFNDARLALALARTAATRGALLVNYCRAEDLCFEAGKVAGLMCQDTQTGQQYRINSRCVVNAAGVWVVSCGKKTEMPIRMMDVGLPAPWWPPVKVFTLWWTGNFWAATLH